MKASYQWLRALVPQLTASPKALAARFTQAGLEVEGMHEFGEGTEACLVVAVVSPYRRDRLLSFLDPSAHGSGSGYQVMQSLIGLGSGHLVGAGLGGGQAQWGFLPNAQTDFIFSVIGEELGFIGAALHGRFQ